MNLVSGARAHSKVEMLDGHGLPMIVIILSGGIPWNEWTDYCDDHQLGIASQRHGSRALGLLLDYALTQGPRFQKVEDRHRLLQEFAKALIVGTIAEGADATGLYWLPRSIRNAKSIIKFITRFSDWLVKRNNVIPLNPSREATVAEQIAFWAEWKLKSRGSLLSHLKSAAKAQGASRIARVVAIKRRTPKASNHPKSFPPDMLGALLLKGFSRPKASWTQCRDQMITLLMDGGGLRLSECLHIWVSDVQVDPADPRSALVRVFHPSEGIAQYVSPGTRKLIDITRAEYLRLVYDRAPLTDIPGQRGVGWKNPLLQDARAKYLHVFWSSPYYSRTFLSLYRKYCSIRPRVRLHPYLFVTKKLNPLYVRSFEKNHAAAVRRIGLAPSIANGTVPHGHRHAYSQRLRRAKMDGKVIQVALHHQSVLSQDTYTQPEAAEVFDAMRLLDQQSKAPTWMGNLH